ncbi:hypothetical protein [Actinomycetospora flava]|uniref:Glycosyl hydrolase family 39 n=1 Tax=Actinomycetospora flava TaxID=3129232 RepID=A0ABU8MA98_9PSEU
MRPLLTALVLAVVVLVSCGAGAGSTAPGPDWGWVAQERPLSLGVTHMQYSLDAFGDPSAVARGREILRGAGRWQNQHLMGFGVQNPEPSPGVRDWTSLDARMRLIAGTGGTTVLTLAGAPDWMKGGAPGATDWAEIETAPEPEHFDDFARLSADAVARYPQVAAVQVWNEFKGFHDAATNTWDAAAYTDLYNRIHRAVKQVRPDVLVGGPYVPLDAWSADGRGGTPSDVRGPWGVTDGRALDAVSYWLAHYDGADFLTIDGGTGTKDAGLITTPTRGVDRFAALTRWLRERSDLPIWWAEFYPEPADTETRSDTPQRAVMALEAVAAFARSGVDTALLWQPQAGEPLRHAALWTDVATAAGGTPTPLTEPWTWLAPRLARGEVEVGRSPDTRLLGFRAADGVLVVNSSAESASVATTAGPLDLPGYATAVLPRF